MSHYISLDDRQEMHTRPTTAPPSRSVPSNESLRSIRLGGNPNAAPWSTSGIPPWSTATRPLSDIRELTEPSLIGSIRRKPSLNRKPSNASDRSQSKNVSLSRKPSLKAGRPEAKSADRDIAAYADPQKLSDTPGDRSSCSSIYSIPLANVPPRSTSKLGRKGSIDKDIAALLDPPPARGKGFTIPSHGRARSPVKQQAARFNPVTSDSERRIPSRTFRRNPSSADILDAPCHRHPRVSVEINANAPLFVGGGSIEGHVQLNVDNAERLRHKRAVAIARISVDLLGVEEMTASKRHVFLDLATELIDNANPPPLQMVESPKQLSPIDPFWLLKASISSIPFMLSLPLDTGPPPFQSKHARIRYILSVTLLIRDQSRQYLVRSSQDVSVLSVFDPEKALVSLPSPLTATDEFVWRRESSTETLHVTAGLHRQVWVSGTDIFVDVHIVNRSRKTIRRVELQLERNILCYKHTAAATLEKSASQARIFDSNERVTLIRSAYKQGVNNWCGVQPHTTDTRTYDLALPRGHATVKCGKFFEVRYFLNIIIGSTHSKLVTVQLPIVLIHINSLDVVPNSVAQVAAAIEEKRATAGQYLLDHPDTHSPRTRSSSRATANMHRARRPSESVQGRAFAAPRIQSIEKMRADADALAHVGQILDSSPRRYVKDAGPLPTPDSHHRVRKMASSFEYHTPPSNRKGRVMLDNEREEIKRRLKRVGSVESTKAALTAARGLTLYPPNRVNSRSSRRHVPRLGIQSAGGFRQGEIENEPEIVLGLKHSSNAASATVNRTGSGRAHNFQFPALGRSRSQSRERWKGLGWFGGSGKGEKS